MLRVIRMTIVEVDIVVNVIVITMVIVEAIAHMKEAPLLGLSLLA